jgi:hypothetical protein
MREALPRTVVVGFRASGRPRLPLMREHGTRNPLPSFRNSTTSSVSSFILFLIPGPLACLRPPVPSSLVPRLFVCPRAFFPYMSLTPPSSPFFPFFSPRRSTPCVPSICGVPYLGATRWSPLFLRCLVSPYCDGRGGAAAAAASAASAASVVSWALPDGRFQLFGFPSVHWFRLARCGA